jgi:hypothetical protein
MTGAQEKEAATAYFVKVKALIDKDAAQAGFPNKTAIRVLLAGFHYYETGNYTMAIFQAIAAEGKLRAK